MALLEQEALAGRSRRDLTNLMERFGVVSSARRFAAIAELRNKLAHDYPNDPAKQAERLNDAYGAAPDLLRILDAIRGHVTAKGLADLGAFGPIAPPPVSRRPSA